MRSDLAIPPAARSAGNGSGERCGTEPAPGARSAPEDLRAAITVVQNTRGPCALRKC